MHDFKQAAAAANDFETAKTVFLKAFGAAAAEGRLEAFRTACVELLLDPAHLLCRPYAFAYEARGYLNDHNFWSRPAEGKDFQPKPELLEALARCLDRSEAINCRDNYYWLIISGITGFVSGDLTLAFRQLALASTYSDFYRVVKCDLGGGAAFAKTYPTAAQLALLRAQPKFDREARFVADFARPRSMVFSVAFDVIYARAFGFEWIRTASRLGTEGLGLHFHVIFLGGPDAALLAALRDEAARLGVALAISTDQDIVHDRAYFSTARFTKGSSLLRRFKCPLFLVDADAFLPHPETFRDTFVPRILAETRVLGLLGDGPWDGYLPWRRFSATWMLCPYSPPVEAFLDSVADCIEYFWDARGQNWWIDQMGLEVGRRSVIAELADPPRFGQIYTELPGLFDTGEAYKIAQISKLPEMEKLLASGMSYWQALLSLGQ